MKRVIVSTTVNRTNNIKRICNFYKVGRPTFVDTCVGGYRISLGALGYATSDPTEAQVIRDEIARELGIECQVRVRRGYGRLAGLYDIIIPQALDSESLSYDYN